MTDEVTLPARFDGAAVRDVLQILKTHQGQAVVIDGTGVSFCGALGLQVLVAARRHWQAEGCAFSLSASEAFSRCADQLGVALSDLGALAENGENP